MDRKNKLASSFGSFLRVLCDLMVLNVLWLICSLPVVTVGLSTSALCCVSLKLARGEPVATLRTFFGAMKQNLIQALLLGLIGLAGLAVAVVDWYFTVAQVGSVRTVYIVVSVLVSAVVMAYWAWAFALNAGFENSLGGTIKNAFSLAFVEPGKTLLIWIAFAVPVLCFLFLPEAVVIYIGWAYILFAVSVPAYIAARAQVKVFARFGGPAARIEPDEDNFYQ